MISRCLRRMVVAACGMSTVAWAQAPALVLDINPSTAPNASSPTDFVVAGGVSYFAATTVAEGTELWRTDGTPSGTSLVKDICPGYRDSNPSNLTAVGSELFFTADDCIHGTELWKSDGTIAGTVLVKDIQLGANGSFPQLMAALNGKLAFFINDPTQLELWLSDGTAAGTNLSATGTTGWTHVSSPVVVGGILYFVATNGSSTDELWRSDGTGLGTTIVTAINPAGFIMGPLTVGGNTLFFAGNDGSNANELWRSDGTATGTKLISSFASGDHPHDLVVAGTHVFFSDATPDSLGQVWMTDGGIGSASIPKTVCTNPALCPSFIPALGALGANAYFAQLALPGAGDWEIWQINGTTSAEVAGFANAPANFVSSSSDLFFLVQTGGAFNQLWKTDGTVAGTNELKAIGSSATDDLTAMAPFGSGLVFGADDGVVGREPWISKGAPANTILLRDVSPGIGSSNPVQWSRLGNEALFVANDGINGYQVWSSDGGTLGTHRVANIGATANPGPFTAVGNTSYFTADDGSHGRELWRTDGTGGGTSLVKDIDVGQASSNPTSLAALGGALLFAAEDDLHGRELWTSDGTISGTVMLNDIRLDGGSDPADLTTVGSTVFFDADDGVHGRELWKSDGTASGTVLVSDIAPGISPSSPNNFAVLGSTLFFSADDGTGQQLWKSDGTTAGTILVKKINSGGSSSPTNLTVIGSVLFFSATDGTSRQLWKSDGSPAGTVMVKLINPSGDANPTNLTGVDGVLFFAATEATHGTELWTSDGTSPGTVLVKDIAAGPGSSGPSNLFPVGDQLYFAANDGANGIQLWTSDGTSAGTTALGPSSLAPGPFQAIPSILLFGATDGLGSRELWSLSVDTTPPVITPTLTGTLGTNGWFVSDVTVSFAVTDPESGTIRSSVGCTGGSVTQDTPDASFPCIATSAGGTSSTTVVIQRDTVPPEIQCPANDTVEATGAGGATVNFAAATATDNLDPSPEIAYSTAEGATFPLGTTVDTATASDQAGNTTSCNFNVVVNDTTPPVLTCPSDVFVDDQGASSSVVTLPAPIVSDVADPSPSVTYSPASGSSFPLGQTTVTVTATDHSGNHQSCTFVVRVGCESGTCAGTGKKKSEYSLGCGGCSTPGNSSAGMGALVLAWLLLSFRTASRLRGRSVRR